jgi:DNA-binding protein H-NS
LKNRIAAMGQTIGEEALPELSKIIVYLTHLAGESEGFARTVGRVVAKVLRFMLDAVQGARLMYTDIKNALGLLRIAWSIEWKTMHLLLAKAWRAIVDKVEAGVNAVIEAINAIGERISRITGGRFGWHIETISLDKYKNKLGDVAKLQEEIERLWDEAAKKREAWMKERAEVIEGWSKVVEEAERKAAEAVEGGGGVAAGAAEEAARRVEEAYSKPIEEAVEELEKVKPVRPVTIKVEKVENNIQVQEISEENVEKVADMLTDVFLRKLTEKTGFYVGV